MWYKKETGMFTEGPINILNKLHKTGIKPENIKMTLGVIYFFKEEKE